MAGLVEEACCGEMMGSDVGAVVVHLCQVGTGLCVIVVTTLGEEHLRFGATIGHFGQVATEVALAEFSAVPKFIPVTLGLIVRFGNWFWWWAYRDYGGDYCWSNCGRFT